LNPPPPLFPPEICDFRRCAIRYEPLRLRRMRLVCSSGAGRAGRGCGQCSERRSCGMAFCGPRPRMSVAAAKVTKVTQGPMHPRRRRISRHLV
jgi:hypothetical protein